MFRTTGLPQRVLVRDTQPVARVQMSLPTLPPGVALVYVTSDGRAEQRDRVLSRAEALSGRYRTMHLVDVSRHRTDVPAERVVLPTRQDLTLFRGTVRLGWRVTDAAAIIREGIAEGDSIVEAWVLDAMRKITRRYDVYQCELAEAEINALTASGPVDLLGSGISVDHVSAHVTVDDITKEHNEGIARQRGELALEQMRMDAVAHGVQGEFGLIALHLRHHPTESLQVLQLLHGRQQELERHQNARFTSSTELFTKMAEEGLLQDVDVDQIRDALLRNIVSDVTAGSTVTGGRPQPQPLEIARPPVSQAGGGSKASPSTEPGSSGVTGWKSRRS